MKNIGMLVAITLLSCLYWISGTAFGLESGQIRVQGDSSDLKGIREMSVECRIRGANLYLKGEGDSPSTNSVVASLTRELTTAGISVKADAPTVLVIEFDTPGGTLMTYVNFVVMEKAVLLRDRNAERKITIWMATGYNRAQVYPEPVGRLTRTLIRHWADANGEEVDLPAERVPDAVVVLLLPDQKCEIAGEVYPHERLLDVLKAIPDVGEKTIVVRSGWETRGDAGKVFRMLKDAGINARIDFAMGDR